ncbi:MULTISPECIES: hypothetical protein [unclassified Actinotalea]|uniref:hypothetical protein n=1 Tax=unclassified Actinotalea TaxID=2638618 RepID=UPI0015F51FBC|nr:MULTISPECIES: hypothetical protein [unclassified Actinotalea]
MSIVRAAVAAATTAAAVTAVGRRALGATLGGSPRWTRVNHRGAPISLLEGPAVAAGLVAGALAGGRSGSREALAGAVAAAGGATFGLVDDLSEDVSRTRKGLRGHLGALAHGELTTGGLKVLGIGATGVVASALALERGTTGRVAHAIDVLCAGALVAGTANLVNLLDLRPGRALKAGALLAAPALVTAGAPAAAAALGAAGAALPRDLGEQDMLGDGGANALGAIVGTALVLGTPRPVRAALLAAVVGLTLASERVSFTAVIARTPALRALDEWGRRRDRA